MAGGDEIEDLLGGYRKKPEEEQLRSTIEGNGPEQPKNENPSEMVQVNGPKDAPTVFADGLLFATLVNGNVRLQFAEYVPHATNGPDPGLKTRVIANVIMPLEGYRGMMEYLNTVSGPYIYGEDASDGE